jgi:hypothetical protein
MDIRLDDHNVSEQLSETLSYYRERHAATTWLVTPTSAPPDIAEYLREHACMPRERWLGMAARPWQIDWSNSMPPMLRLVG